MYRPSLRSTCLFASAALIALAASGGCKTSLRLRTGAAASGEGTQLLLALSVSPPPGRTEVGPLSEVRVVFREEIDPSSVDSAALLVTDLFTGSPLPGSTTLNREDGRSLEFRAKPALPPSGMFSVDVAAGLRSVTNAVYSPSSAPGAPHFPAFYSTFSEAPVLSGLLRVVSSTSNSLELEWGAASDSSSLDGAAINYKIYAQVAPAAIDCSRPPVRETGPGVVHDVVTRLDPGSEYRVAVRASDPLGNLSAPSNEVIARTQTNTDSQPPQFDGVVRLEFVLLETKVKSPTKLKAVWNPGRDLPDPAAPLTYNVYLATESGKQNFDVPAITSPPGATEVVIGGLVPDTEYFVIVRAMDAAGNEESNTVEAPVPRRTPVSFSQNVLRILTLPQGYDPSLCWPVCTSFRQPGGCARGGCHVGVSPAGGLRLTQYDDYKNSPTIVAGKPERSDFVARLRTTGARRMPRGGTCNLLDDCIQVIERWIAQGVENN